MKPQPEIVLRKKRILCDSFLVLYIAVMLDDVFGHLRSALQFAGPDTLLVAASAGLVVGLLILGLSGNGRRRRRWMTNAGWLVIIISTFTLIYSMIGRSGAPPQV